MAKQMASPPRVLVIDDDSDLRLFLLDLLTEEGYRVDASATLDEALALIDAHMYHLILTDLLMHSLSDPLRSAVTVRQAAYPTPVVAMSAWNISAAEAAQAGLTRLLPKPFDLDNLLALVTECMDTTLDAEQQQEAETLEQYCEAFNAHDFDTCVSLCAEDVRFYPAATSFAGLTGPVVGQASLRSGLQHMLLQAPDIRFDSYLIHPQPKGLALRCVKSWQEQAVLGGRAIRSASMSFQFDGERIAQISLRMDSLESVALARVRA